MLIALVECGRGFISGVFRGGGQGDVVLSSEFEEEGWAKTAFEVEVVFAFWEVGEEGVEGGFAHRC